MFLQLADTHFNNPLLWPGTYHNGWKKTQEKPETQQETRKESVTFLVTDCNFKILIPWPFWSSLKLNNWLLSSQWLRENMRGSRKAVGSSAADSQKSISPCFFSKLLILGTMLIWRMCCSQRNSNPRRDGLCWMRKMQTGIQLLSIVWKEHGKQQMRRAMWSVSRFWSPLVCRWMQEIHRYEVTVIYWLKQF